MLAAPSGTALAHHAGIEYDRSMLHEGSIDMKIKLPHALQLLAVAGVSAALTSRFVDAQNREEPTLTLAHIGVAVQSPNCGGPIPTFT